MAGKIQLKRSAVAGKTPTVSDIDLGEPAINTNDGKLFIKKSVGGTESIVEVGDLKGGADGTAGAPSFAFTSDTDTGLYRIGADAIGITTGGVMRLAVTNDAVLIQGTLGIDGTLAGEDEMNFEFNNMRYIYLTDVTRLDGSHIVGINFENCFISGGSTARGLTWRGNIISRSSDGGAIFVCDDERPTLVNLADLDEDTLGGGVYILENTGVAPTAAGQVLGSILGRGKWDANGGENPTTAYIAFVSGGPWTQASCPMDIAFGATTGRTPTEQFRIRGSGGAKVTGGLELQNGGLKFPAAAVLSADPNTLDDYEEVEPGVTFTPVLTFAGTGTAASFNAVTTAGRATKIGRMVFYDMAIVLTSKGTATGTATVSGLPYAPITANPTSNAFVRTFGGGATITDPFGTFSTSNSTITLRNFNAGTYTALTAADFTDTTTIRISGHYTAAE